MYIEYTRYNKLCIELYVILSSAHWCLNYQKLVASSVASVWDYGDHAPEINAPEKDGDTGFRQLGMMETCEIIWKSYESVHSDILKTSEESEGTKIDFDVWKMILPLINMPLSCRNTTDKLSTAWKLHGQKMLRLKNWAFVWKEHIFYLSIYWD